jgi:hypothetical protein
MPTLTQGYQTGEFLLTDEESYSRDVETVTIAGAVALPSGTVLGKITATGKFVRYDAAGTDDGRRTAAGVLYNELPGTNGDYQAVVIKRTAEVVNLALNGGAGVDSAGNLALRAIGIVVR